MEPESMKMEPLAPLGRPTGDFAPPGSILRGPKNGSIFEGSLVRKKSMDVSLGAAKGRKKRPGGRASARQELLFGKMAPRACLARARLINKLI